MYLHLNVLRNTINRNTYSLVAILWCISFTIHIILYFCFSFHRTLYIRWTTYSVCFGRAISSFRLAGSTTSAETYTNARIHHFLLPLPVLSFRLDCDTDLFAQQLVGENNPDKEKVVHEFQSRLRGSLNNKNMGLYVKAFMRYVYTHLVSALPIKHCAAT